jgi:uncharacterized protein with FMN-binding domain
MKRVLFTITATVAGIVSLLSFKSHGHPLTAAGALPSAGLPGSTTSTPPVSTTHSAPAGSSSSAPASAQPKTYLGAPISTRYGVVQVKATITSGKLTSVAFVKLEAFDGRSQEINSQAAPILLQETVQAGNANIQTVSGATYTSDGYVQSLQSALDAAGVK